MACRCHDRHIDLFGQLPEIRCGVAPFDSSASENHRASSLAKHVHGAPH